MHVGCKRTSVGEKVLLPAIMGCHSYEWLHIVIAVLVKMTITVMLLI